MWAVSVWLAAAAFIACNLHNLTVQTEKQSPHLLPNLPAYILTFLSSYLSLLYFFTSGFLKLACLTKYTNPSHRGLFVGSKLLSHLPDWFRRLSYSEFSGLLPYACFRVYFSSIFSSAGWANGIDGQKLSVCVLTRVVAAAHRLLILHSDPDVFSGHSLAHRPQTILRTLPQIFLPDLFLQAFPPANSHKQFPWHSRRQFPSMHYTANFRRRGKAIWASQTTGC